MRIHRSLFPLAAIALAATSRPAAAQDPTPGADLPTDAQSPITSPMHGLVFIPVVLSTPALGPGGGGVAAYRFRFDSSSTSAVGVGGVYTFSSSWMGAIGMRTHFRGDRREAAGGVAVFDAHYDFFGVGYADGAAGTKAPIAQRGDAEMVDFLVRARGVYIGPLYMHRGITTRLDGASPGGEVGRLAHTDDDYNASLLGAFARWDTRNNQFAPQHGIESELSMLFARDWLASSVTYDSYQGYLNDYVAIGAAQVLALRATGCGVAGHDAPIWELCMYGIHSDLRGYAGGRYRDRAMFSGQAEFRTPVYGRFGAALFGGVGAVAPSFSAVAWDKLLPAGGLGVRYIAFPESHVTVGADYAWGRDGGAFYLRVGEAF